MFLGKSLHLYWEKKNMAVRRKTKEAKLRLVVGNHRKRITKSRLCKSQIVKLLLKRFKTVLQLKAEGKRKIKAISKKLRKNSKVIV
jgi:hypothetical protein